jgi:hypothetical protein
VHPTGHRATRPRDTPFGDVDVASRWGIANAERATDAGIELTRRAIAALDRGDTARAQRCLDHVERLLPADSPLVPPQVRTTLAEVREAVRRARAGEEAVSRR